MAINTSITTTIDKCIINGVTIDFYSDYFVLNEITYSQEPTRSVAGVLDDINNIPSVVIPRLFFSFNYLDSTSFRKLLTCILAKKEFDVTYYDFNDGVCYTRPFYLKPYSKTMIFTRMENESDVIFKGIRNFSFELVATMRDTLPGLE